MCTKIVRSVPFLSFSKIASVSIFLGLVGCGSSHKAISIAHHEFVIEQLREPIAEEIRKAIEARGVDVQMQAEGDRETLGPDLIVSNYRYTVGNAEYTERDFLDTVYSIRDEEREDPIALQETKIVQRYASGTGAGTAKVELSVRVTKNARAFYKESEEQIQGATYKENKVFFNYPRRKDQEYVDIFIVPDGKDDKYRPAKFRRISLSHPYEEVVMDWESRPWYWWLWPF